MQVERHLRRRSLSPSPKIVTSWRDTRQVLILSRWLGASSDDGSLLTRPPGWANFTGAGGHIGILLYPGSLCWWSWVKLWVRIEKVFRRRQLRGHPELKVLLSMKYLNDYVRIYKEQLDQGDILIAYNALVKFVMKTRTDFMKQMGDRYSFAGILHGYMDYTYFYYSNDYLKKRKLKFGLVLNHLEMRFEIWLLGNTIPVQKEYWELLRASKWNEGREEMPKYSALEAVIVPNPDFNDLEALQGEIAENLIQVSDEIISLIK